MKILAIDFGGKRIGLASGDSVSKIAFPKAVLKNTNEEEVVRDLLHICDAEGYEVVVFGAPFHMSGEESGQLEKVRIFADKFKRRADIDDVDVCVEFFDERLSSFEADQYLMDFKGKKVRKEEGDRDMMAAKVILDRWFER